MVFCSLCGRGGRCVVEAVRNCVFIRCAVEVVRNGVLFAVW